jgi:hypothetical protein
VLWLPHVRSQMYPSDRCTHTSNITTGQTSSRVNVLRLAQFRWELVGQLFENWERPDAVWLVWGYLAALILAPTGQYDD